MFLPFVANNIRTSAKRNIIKNSRYSKNSVNVVLSNLLCNNNILFNPDNKQKMKSPSHIFEMFKGQRQILRTTTVNFDNNNDGDNDDNKNKSKSKNSSNEDDFFSSSSIYFALISLLLILGPLQISLNEGDDDKNKLYDIKETAKFLTSGLHSFRNEKFSKRHKSIPKIKVIPDKNNNNLKNTYGLQFEVSRSDLLLDVLAAMLPPIQKQEEQNKNQPIQLHTATKPSSDTTALSFVFDKGNGSLLLHSVDVIGAILSEQKERQPSSSPSTSQQRKVIIPPKSTVTLYKDEGFTKFEIESIIAGYKFIHSNDTNNFRLRRQDGSSRNQGTSGSNADPINELKKLGVEVFVDSLKTKNDNDDEDNNSTEKGLDWDSLAGYQDVKDQIENTIIMALKNPDIYDSIAKATRQRFESNRPRAILFEGPPGTGKTLTARIMASRCEIPMVLVSVEKVMSKWLGESERNLSKIFELCNQMGGCLIFIDEIDAFAGSRDSNMHEATRRVLSVLLQNIEGFKTDGKNVLVCATNRKQDLDAALMSRFDISVRYDLPDLSAREKIFKRYARHLKKNELELLAKKSQQCSCRDIKEICENTERHWASKKIRNQVKGDIPNIQQYEEALKFRSKSHQGRKKDYVEV